MVESGRLTAIFLKSHKVTTAQLSQHLLGVLNSGGTCSRAERRHFQPHGVYRFRTSSKDLQLSQWLTSVV
jgi:hypothetical protein